MCIVVIVMIIHYFGFYYEMYYSKQPSKLNRAILTIAKEDNNVIYDHRPQHSITHSLLEKRGQCDSVLNDT